MAMKGSARGNRRLKGRPSKVDGGASAELIVQTTRELLKKVPPNSLTRLKIAESAGVTPALIRYYFGNKHNLYNAVVRQISDEFVTKLKQLANEKGPVEERFRAYIKSFLYMLAENPNFHQLVMEQIHFGQTEEARRYSRALSKRIVGDLSKMVEEGDVQGELVHMDARFLHVAIIGICEFFVLGAGPILRETFRQSESSAELLDRYAEFVGDLFIKGIAVRPEQTDGIRRIA